MIVKLQERLQVVHSSSKEELHAVFQPLYEGTPVVFMPCFVRYVCSALSHQLQSKVECKVSDAKMVVRGHMYSARIAGMFVDHGHNSSYNLYRKLGGANPQRGMAIIT